MICYGIQTRVYGWALRCGSGMGLIAAGAVCLAEAGEKSNSALPETVTGFFGYIISLGLCAWAFQTGNVTVVAPGLFGFIAAHAIGQGTVIWVLISEIFPNRNRAAGQTLGSFTHWFFAALMTLIFPVMAEIFVPSVIFGFFCFMMVLQLVWVKFMVPETKGRSLEEIQKSWESGA